MMEWITFVVPYRPRFLITALQLHLGYQVRYFPFGSLFRCFGSSQSMTAFLRQRRVACQYTEHLPTPPAGFELTQPARRDFPRLLK